MAKSSEAKQAFVVFGALALGWLAVELAFKPFLDKVRSAILNSDPATDPDDHIVADASSVDKSQSDE